MLVSELAYWINERDTIRIRKECEKPKPWTDDPVFQKTYFCNVHREDDKVTRWLKDNWRPKYPHQNYELAMVMARFINWPPSLQILRFPLVWDKDWYLSQFRRIKGKKWGNAYVITTHGQKMPKDEYAFNALDKMHVSVRKLRELTTLQEAHVHLQTYDGIGSFLSGQIIADLKNTKGHPLYEADDWNSFCSPGPGSLRGLAWFFEVDRVAPSKFHELINIVYQETMPHVIPSIRPIHMQDLQNCLCEFDKYMRVKTGKGRSKRSYPGEY